MKTLSGYGRTGGRFDPGKNDCLFSAFERDIYIRKV